MGKKNKKNWYNEKQETINVFEDPIAILEEADGTYNKSPMYGVTEDDLDRAVIAQMKADRETRPPKKEKVREYAENLEEFKRIMDADREEILRKKETPQKEFRVEARPIREKVQTSTTYGVMLNPSGKKERENPVSETRQNGIMEVGATLVKELGRVIFKDKLTSCSYHLSYMETIDFDPSRIDFSNAIVQSGADPEEGMIHPLDLMSDLYTILIITSVPTAIYRIEDFVEKFKLYEELDPNRYMIGGYGSYVYVWMIDRNFRKLILDDIPAMCAWENSIPTVIQMLLGMAKTKMMLNNICNIFDESVTDMLVKYCNNDVKLMEMIIDSSKDTKFAGHGSSRVEADEVFERLDVLDLGDFYEKVRDEIDLISPDEYSEDEDDDDEIGYPLHVSAESVDPDDYDAFGDTYDDDYEDDDEDVYDEVDNTDSFDGSDDTVDVSEVKTVEEMADMLKPENVEEDPEKAPIESDFGAFGSIPVMSKL